MGSDAAFPPSPYRGSMGDIVQYIYLFTITCQCFTQKSWMASLVSMAGSTIEERRDGDGHRCALDAESVRGPNSGSSAVATTWSCLNLRIYVEVYFTMHECT